MTYIVPVEFRSRVHKGNRRSNVDFLSVDAETPFIAFQRARDLAASRIGTSMADQQQSKLFRIAEVRIRTDMFQVSGGV